jgi:hypothetical protein
MASREPTAGASRPFPEPANRPDPPLAGLRMSPAERLRWLEETMETLRRWRGRARAVRP